MSGMARRCKHVLAFAALVLVPVVGLPRTVPPAAADDASYAATVVADGAAAYWRLDEAPGASVAADASNHGRNGTYAGGVQLGVPGGLPASSDTAASFDGVTGKVSLPDDAATRLNGAFSIEFWANQNGFANTWPGILGKGTGTTSAGGYLIYATSDGRLSFKRAGSETLTTAGALTTGRWHQFAVTYDGSALRWYVDGALNSTTARSFPSNANKAALVVGQADQAGNNRLDEVALYPSALSAAKIANHFRLAGQPPSPYATAVVNDGALSYWRLGESPGVTTALDASGHNRPATYAGGVQLGVPGALTTSSDTAASFDGSTGKATVADDAATRLNGPFTIEFWANQNAFVGPTPGLLGKGAGTGANGYLIYARTDGRLSFKRSGLETMTTANALVTGAWHLFTLTSDGTTTRWYVDGGLNASAARAYSTDTTTKPLTLGQADKPGNNRLDEVALYPSALSAGQIANHYSLATSAPPSPYASMVTTDGATAYWRLGEPPGAITAADASSHGHVGTYSGGTQLGVPGALVGANDTAASFDGITGQVSVPDDVALRLNGGFSVEFWANQNAFANAFPGVVIKGDATTKDGYLIYATPDGRLSYKRDASESLTGPGVLVTGQWHHFVLTYDGDKVRWFVDGALNSTTHQFFEQSSVGTAPLVIGQGDHPGNNRLDEVAFYGQALTPAQVAHHYAVGRATATEVAPGPPTAAQAVPGDASAAVQWTAPASDGGTKITSYRVTVSPGGATFDVPGWATSAQPTGLTDGVAYTFTVTATNSVGTGSASTPSNAITPTSSTAAAVLDATAGDWPMYTHDISGSGRNGDETTLNPLTALTVGQKWTWFANANLFDQPAVGFGGVFVGDNNGWMHRVSPAGVEVWKTYIGLDPGTCARQGVASSATLATFGTQHLVYIGGGDGQLYALDADTGAIVWRTALGDNSNGAFAWSSPFLLNNALYMGLASNADCPLVQGAMLKLDPATGRITARTNMAPDGCLGGGIWGSPTYADGLLYATTGTEDGCSSPTPLEISIVAFDPVTLAVQSSWHIPEADQAPDGDWGSVPTVFNAPIPGTSGKFVGAANKNGVFYALDRTNLAAGPVWTTTIATSGGCPYCGDGSIAPAAYDGTYLYTAGGTTTALDGTTTCATALRALRPVDGSIAWEDCRSGALDGPTLGPVTIANGVVLYCEGHFINGVDANTGTRLFSSQNTNPAAFAQMFGGPSISNGVIYAGGVDGNLYAIGP
jgi:outer membrane protein assembly factor BamB